MKTLIVGIVMGCALLVACTAPAEETEAKGKAIWEVVGTQEIGGNDYAEVRHKKTGCHYTLVDYGASGLTYTPMFIQQGINQVPYCTDKK